MVVVPSKLIKSYSKKDALSVSDRPFICAITGETLAVARKDTEDIEFYNITNGNLIGSATDPVDVEGEIAFNGSYSVFGEAGQTDNRLFTYDDTGTLISTFDSGLDSVNVFALNSNNECVLAGHDSFSNFTGISFDVETGNQIASWSIFASQQFVDIAISKNQTVIAENAQNIRVYDISTGNLNWEDTTTFSDRLRSVDMNESYVVTGDYAGEVHLFYADSGDVKHTQTDPTDDTRAVLIQGETYVAGTEDADGNVYAYSTDDGSLRWSSQPFGTTDRVVGLAAKTGIIGVYQQNQGIKFFDLLSGDEYNENTTVSGQSDLFVASKNSEYMALPDPGGNVVTTFESGEIVGKQDVI
jgi:hypothetical protein